MYGFMIFLGLFMCFKGHRFFQVSLFFTGYFVAAMITYVILAYMKLTDEGMYLCLFSICIFIKTNDFFSLKRELYL